MSNFVHLAVHSQFSRNGFPTTAELVNAAVDHGQTALALTDTDLTGALEFRGAAQAQGIKPIIGLSIRVEGAGYRLEEITLLAAARLGWKSLVAINNIAHEAGNHHKSVDYSQLREHSAGLIAVTTPRAELSLLGQIFDRDHLFMAATSPDFPSRFPDLCEAFTGRIIALPTADLISSEDDMWALAADSFAWSEAIQLTATLADRIDDDVIPAPGRYVPGPENADAILAAKVLANAREIYGELDYDVSTRLSQEITAIERTE